MSLNSNVSDAMTTDESQLFEVLDHYSRSLHKCFLAEMFLDKDGNEYVLCFRPVGASPDSSGRYACQYVRIGRTEARIASDAKALTSGIKDKLERQLPLLSKPPD
jgi:hypothetical protein